MTELESRYLNAKKQLFSVYYGKRLNPEQCEAVFHTQGPLLVLAGAGSGKTTVLVNRIEYLIKHGNAYHSDYVPDDLDGNMVSELERAANFSEEEIGEILCGFSVDSASPWSVLAITFTNKAAAEIRDRLMNAFDDPDIASSIWAGTFHSVCLRILRRNADLLGYRDGFSIYDADDSKRLIAQCMKDLDIDDKYLPVRSVQTEISSAKDKLMTAEQFDISGDPRTKDIKRVYTLYTKKLMEYNAVDFDDIIMKTVELLTDNPQILSYWQKKFRYILVDEYQDSNYAQFALVQLLSGYYNNIMVVGDDDQSIYRFRGATIENILNFTGQFENAKVVKLEQNYRSTENILSVANAIIKKNENRHSKSLWSKKGDGELITLRMVNDQNEEGSYIADRIKKEVANKGKHYSDFAVLYRVNELSRSLESAFVKKGVPYRIFGGTKFYDRKEVKDMIAYLGIISSDSDALRLKRIINEPKRKIGEATVKAIEEIAMLEGDSMLSVMRRSSEYTALQKNTEKLISFTSMIDGIRSSMTLPSLIIERVFEESGYHDMLIKEGFEGQTKIDHVMELVSAAKEYEAKSEQIESEPTLYGFLEEINLLGDTDSYDEKNDVVSLMTIHSAKGLEFSTVFLAGMEDGIFPSERNKYSEFELSEERRLAYVAVTRAKEKLYITHTESRLMYGRVTKNPLSLFIREEAPMNLIEEERPLREPPRAGFYREDRDHRPKRGFGELNRPSEISSVRKPKVGYGLVKLPEGSRVRHKTFGVGVIISVKDLGGDVLYQVRFDGFGEKKLMGTFAKLEKID